MKVLLLLSVSTWIAHHEAALLSQEASQQSETNMTLEQALRALPPVPGALKTYLVAKLGQNVSAVVRTRDEDAPGARSLRGSGRKLSLIDVEAYSGRGSQSARLGADATPPTIQALEGSTGAAAMLNKMLTENQEKMDGEEARFRSFKVSQRRQITEASLAVSQFTANANKAHGEELLANARLRNSEAQLPIANEALKAHGRGCYKNQQALKEELKLHEEEETQMEEVVKLAECSDQTTLIQCPSKGRGKRKSSSFSFGTLAARQAAAQLKLAATRQAVQEVLGDAFGTAVDTNEEEDGASSSSASNSSASPETTNSSALPAPLPKRKCSVRNNPNCPNLADKLMTMLADISDRVRQIKREMLRASTECTRIENNFKDQIGDLVKIGTDATADLALALKTLNENTVAASQQQGQFNQLTEEMGHTVTTYENTRRGIESEACGIRQIRTALYGLASMKKMIRDCHVSKWDVDQQCSATCGTGTMRRTRNIELPPLEGAACPPLAEDLECDLPLGCPVPCQLGTWSGWTECSAGCGGGVKQRSRVIHRHPVNGGDPCDLTSESQDCNMQACNVPCVLKPWTSWTKCSKHCGKGHRTRVRSIKEKAVGDGHCPSEFDPARLWRVSCNRHACIPAAYKPYLHCKSKMDLVLMLDGSGSMRASGFNYLKESAKKLVDTLELGMDNVVLSVLLFSGPRTWYKARRCRRGLVSDLEQCGMKWVTGQPNEPKWTVDKTEVKQRLNALTWPKGGTMTGMALEEAKSAISDSREDAPATVVVITDGRPSFADSAKQAARSIRKSARLMFVPVGPNVKFRYFNKMASHPLSENIIPNLRQVSLRNLRNLELPSFHNIVIENLCPDVE